ncbi:MAG TPA: hypothetical protein P5081_07000 [Phycisphaerae bacterium]|nr:hypothetical protein [Phycisphaerae bacterium]HRW52620.1 hypothetical protein [Phycisphaerae bacterium]
MKYAAVVQHAREITLMGTADADCWAAPLESVGLTPCRRDHRVGMLISVAAGRWGIHFREVAIGVAACRQPGGVEPDGYFAAYAFHSSRLFAWCERTFFKASHRLATIDMTLDPPVSIEIRSRSEIALRAAMGTTREASRRENVDIVFPVFLPNRGNRVSMKRNAFHVRVAGETDVYPYEPASDFFTVGDNGGALAMPLLADCDFQGTEWLVRRDAIHARTKTRSEAR